MRVGSNKKQKAIILDHANNISQFGKINADRGWSLTMDKAQKALAKNANKNKTSNKGKKYETDYNNISDAEMIALANVKNPQFEKEVKNALSLQGIKAFEELCRIQRRYKITSASQGITWAYACALHFNKISKLTP